MMLGIGEIDIGACSSTPDPLPPEQCSGACLNTAIQMVCGQYGSQCANGDTNPVSMLQLTLDLLHSNICSMRYTRLSCRCFFNAATFFDQSHFRLMVSLSLPKPFVHTCDANSADCRFRKCTKAHLGKVCRILCPAVRLGGRDFGIILSKIVPDWCRQSPLERSECQML
jgi:hypothetical protein